CKPSPQYMQDLLARNLLAQRQSVLEMYRAIAADKPDKALEAIGKISVIPTELYAFAALRNTWSPQDRATYIARPNVFCYVTHPMRNDKGDFVMNEALDIVANDVAVRSNGDAFRVRLEQGVADTDAEALMMPSMRVNTADQFGEAIGKGQKWLLLKDEKDP